MGYDVLVVGAGPAGSCAAIAAADAGASVLMLDRAEFPRYKTCGGGLIGVSLAALPHGFEPPVRERVDAVDFTLRGEAARKRRDEQGVLSLVNRDELDAGLAAHAVGRGVEFRQRSLVSAVTDGDDAVEIRVGGETIRAKVVVGADGSASRVARAVGVRTRHVDLGLEDELAAPGGEWRGRVHLDWGDLPGSYGWVFPKGDVLTVGVIAARGEPARTRAYLDAFERALGLDELPVVRSSGHLTRCREAHSPLGHGRVLVAGDAAGLLEPWTREGISFATRSGSIAGRHAATAAREGPARLVAGYTAEIERGLGAEMAAGERCLAAFERRPGAIHRVVSGTGVGWRSFTRLTRGETTLARALEHRTVRLAVGALSR